MVFKRFFCLQIFLVILILDPARALSQDSHEVGEVYPFRKEIRKCHIAFSSKLDEQSQPQKRINTAVGAYLSDHSPEFLQKSIAQMIQRHGPEYFEEGLLYVTGVQKGGKQAVLNDLQDVFEEFGLTKEQIVIMEVPVELSASPSLSERSKKLVQEVKYFFFNPTLDYEKPIPSEIIAGILGTLAIEIPNAYFMLQNFDHTLDAVTTLAVHGVILFGLVVYNKSLGNWFLRKSFGKPGDILKQAILSFIFVLNFNVGHNFTALIEYFSHMPGYEVLFNDLPAVLTEFGLTQGLTVFVQLLFYRIVMTDSIMAWVRNQKDPLARSMEHGVKTIYAIPDAILLFVAGANLFPIMDSGLFTLSWGHVGIAGLTAVGWGLTRPFILDWKLKWYKKTAGVTKKLSIMLGDLLWKEE